MSHSYLAIGWNRQKKIYDRTLLGGVVFFLLAFLGLGFFLHPLATPEILVIRALGLTAILLLHLIMAIGPLARLDERWLPLLYNRRHMGVTLFILGLAHGLLAIIVYHGLGNMNPLYSLFLANTQLDSLSQFPFQPLGFFALCILFLMAATSHDFWLTALGAPVWKALHMGVYIAWLLLLAHVFLGFLQAETNPLLAALFIAGALGLCALHLLAARGESSLDRESEYPRDEEGYLALCAPDEIPDKRARIFSLVGERVAVFRNEGRFSALSNVCQHQNGPLGEGRIIDGLVTCPWHGYQYRPENGASPPPFTESVPTFRLRIRGGMVWVLPEALPPGTEVEPARNEPGVGT